MKNQIIFIILSFTVLLNACHTPKTEDISETNYTNVLKDCAVVAQYQVIGGDSVLVCDMKAIDDEIKVPFSSLLSSYEIVPLDTMKDVLCSPRWGKTAISENYVLVKPNKEPLRLFNRKTGKFLHQIGNMGSAPTEYISIYQMQIEEDSNIVLIATSRPGRIIRYELSTGNYQTTYPLLFESGDQFYCDVKNKEIIGMGTPLPGDQEGIYYFWKQTFDGKLIQGFSGIEQVGCSNHNQGNGFIDDRSNNFQVYLWDTSDIKQDTLYHYDLKENRLVPKFTLKWGEKIPPHHYIELPHYYYCETADKNRVQYLIDKNTGKGAKIKVELDMFGQDLPLYEIVRYNYDSYTISLLFDPLQVADILCKKDQHKTLAGKVMNPDSLENENSWVFIGTWN